MTKYWLSVLVQSHILSLTLVDICFTYHY